MFEQSVCQLSMGRQRWRKSYNHTSRMPKRPRESREQSHADRLAPVKTSVVGVLRRVLRLLSDRLLGYFRLARSRCLFGRRDSFRITLRHYCQTIHRLLANSSLPSELRQGDGSADRDDWSAVADCRTITEKNAHSRDSGRRRWLGADFAAHAASHQSLHRSVRSM